MRSARSFLSGIIDYAGLFPPASLGMADAVNAYAGYRAGPESDLLARFVLPAGRLGEFSVAARDVLPRGEAAEPWRLSVVAGNGSASDREAILQFNCSHWSGSEQASAVCDAVEMPVTGTQGVADATAFYPEFFQLFLEVKPGGDADSIIGAMAGTRAAAKVRTGGVTVDSIPPAREVLAFIKACKRHSVPFKATAGLHHLVRAEYPLTYEPGAPASEMFGYLNVFLAAAFIDAGAGDDDALAMLTERDASAFLFDDAGVAWRGRHLDDDALERTRREFALSFGSCSFDEPVTEAREVGLV
ncbi:MAG: hypothetical protein ACSLFK_02075 [Gemmatimonadaceae bacterium]